MSFEVDFLVCRILDNAILGMKFLSQKNGSVACKNSLLLIGDKIIQYVDRLIRLLANKV